PKAADIPESAALTQPSARVTDSPNGAASIAAAVVPQPVRANDAATSSPVAAVAFRVLCRVLCGVFCGVLCRVFFGVFTGVPLTRLRRPRSCGGGGTGRAR